ncbi:MAG: hypothetical protein L0K86_19745, partial [Actinomycetia bacterium]|nr:hypothetical protein [Actinomycetes bacterium]
MLTLLDGDRRHGMTVSTVTVVSLRPFVVGAA